MNSGDIPVTVTLPRRIVIHLVREDYLSVSDVFAGFFAVFVSAGSTLAGVALEAPHVDRLHWAFLALTSLSALTFLCLSIVYRRRARAGCARLQ